MLNGDGTGTDTVTVRIGDTIVLENVVSPLSYTVNADCTGTIMVINGPSFDVFIAPDGSEFAEIATGPPGNYPAGIDRRVSRNQVRQVGQVGLTSPCGCSRGTIAGSN